MCGGAALPEGRPNVDLGFQALLPAAVRTVDYCKVKPDERVVVYTDSRRPPALPEAFYAACVARGCDAILVRALEQRCGEDPPPSAVAAMRDADIVFDLVPVPWSDYAPAINGILASGTRVLFLAFGSGLTVGAAIYSV